MTSFPHFVVVEHCKDMMKSNLWTILFLDALITMVDSEIRSNTILEWTMSKIRLGRTQETKMK